MRRDFEIGSRAAWVAVFLCLLSVGCGTQVRSMFVASPSFRASASRGPRAAAPVQPSAEFVERALHGQGLRFGTDGSVGALYWYVRSHHSLVAAARARSGDVVFFDVVGQGENCANHVGIVESVAAGGRITFRELREGVVRRSYVHPGEPRARRTPSGDVANTFLRSKHMTDPAGSRYFAGEMLCGVGRVQGR